MRDWQALLHEAVAASSITAVAAALGVSRPAVSLLVAGKYPGRTERMAARILDVYGRITCPHLGVQVATADCRKHSGSMPTSSPAAIRHWKACQGCQHRPQTDGGH